MQGGAELPDGRGRERELLQTTPRARSRCAGPLPGSKRTCAWSYVIGRFVHPLLDLVQRDRLTSFRPRPASCPARSGCQPRSCRRRARSGSRARRGRRPRPCGPSSARGRRRSRSGVCGCAARGPSRVTQAREVVRGQRERPPRPSTRSGTDVGRTSRAVDVAAPPRLRGEPGRHPCHLDAPASTGSARA